MRYVIALLAVCGLVVSFLALRVHYVTGTEPCDINSHWDCGIVNHSSYATVNGLVWHWREKTHPEMEGTPAPRTGLPVAVLGILGYAAIAIFALLRMRWWTLLLSLSALGFALYLTSIEDKVLQVWCLYCVISQCLIALITLLAIASMFIRPRRA